MMTKKKLPFKATALRNRDPAEPAPSAELPSQASPKKRDARDDGLDLFRQSKAMAPILAADLERKMAKKKQKQKHMESERRRAIAQGKRPSSDSFGEPDEDHDSDGEGSSLPRLPVDVESPGNREREEMEQQQQQQPDSPVGFGSSAQRDSTPVTPPSKRTRYGSTYSRSPKRPRSGQDTPLLTFRRTPARPSPQQTPLKPKRTAIPSGTPIISLLSDSEDDIQPPTSTASTSRRRAPIRDETPLPEADSLGGHDLGDGLIEEEEAVVEVERPEVEEQQQQQPTEPARGEDDDDDEFAEWVQRARQRQSQALASVGDGSGSGVDSPAEPQPVTILVRSEIPDTKPLLVKYTCEKPLRVLRDSWYAAQVRGGVEISCGEEDVVITWCRRIVYPSSSLQTLGIRPLAGGFQVGSSSGGGGSSRGGGVGAVEDRARGGFTPDGLRVLIELWTGEGFAAMKREELERQRRDAGEATSSEDEDQGPEPEEQVRLKVTLRAHGMQATNLTVLGETTVRTLVDAFRKQRGIDPGKVVEVRLDGDVLGEDETMEALGIEDLDSLDVYVR